MKNQTYRIRPYEPGDEVSINKGFNQVFGLNRTIEEWRWKFRPDENGSRIMVAVDENNEVLVHYGSIMLPMWIDGKVILGAQNLDTYALNTPEVLKKRLFLKTAFKYIEVHCHGANKIPFFYGCIGGRIMKLGRLAFKYSEPIEIKYLYKQNSILLRSYGRFFGDQVWDKYVSLDSEVRLNEISDLWERSKIRYNACVVRDGEYVQRRYLSHPINKYMYLEIRKGAELSVFAVLIYQDRLLKLVDILWDGLDPEAIISLESEIWKICQKIGAIKVELWINNDDNLSEILIQSGMKISSNPYDLYLTTRSFVEELDEDDLKERFYFTMGSSDIF